MSLRVLIVDDERLARTKLQRYLASEPDVAAISECANGADAIAEIRRERPDIVFLDVQMPETGGFEVLERIGPGSVPGLIFVTAYDHYAVRAFDVEASDYLLKPFDYERFRTAFDRARRRVASTAASRTTNAGACEPAGKERDARILIHSGRRLVPLDVHNIDWIESADNYARLHTMDGTHVVRETLASLEDRLNSQQFVRIHRRAIVNVSAVTEIHRRLTGGYEVELRNGETFPIGRRHCRQVLDRFRT
jgi:two-component system LytT family response regulator